jgi:hypothetical protein
VLSLAPSSALKPSFLLNPNIPLKMFIGNDLTFTLYVFTASLKFFLAFADIISRFLPAGPVTVEKFCVAFRSGNFQQRQANDLMIPSVGFVPAENFAIFSGVS